MGVLNCTPDSFSDGGLYLSAKTAVDRLARMLDEGADWIDVGGESSRPGAEPVPIEEEWRRVEPALAAARRLAADIPVSIDTVKAEVARRALAEGVSLINDISALRFDPGMTELAAASGAGVVLMHMRGNPRTMQDAPEYQDVGAEVAAFLAEAALGARAGGIERDRIVVDPGIGFGKSFEHNIELLRRLPEMAALGYPLLVGASRKSFLGRILDLPANQRVEGSLAAHTVAALAGAHVIRAHDVQATQRALRVADVIRGSLRI